MRKDPQLDKSLKITVMKRAAISIAFILAWSVQILGQDVHTALTQLSVHENVEKISIGPLGMFFVKMAGGAAGGKEALRGIKGIKSIELLALDDECPAEKKAAIREQLQNLEDDRQYNTLMRIKDGNDRVRILVRKEKKTINEILMIILSDSDDESVVIRLRGSFKESDLADWMAKSNQKKDEQ
jgi:hypothetical protein